MLTCSLPIHDVFDSTYVKALRTGDPEVESHFASYFSRELDRWLRPKLHDIPAVEDVRQETLCRVLAALRRRSSPLSSATLPRFVHGVCRRVLLEYWRKRRPRHTVVDDNLDNPDVHYNPEQQASTSEDILKLKYALSKMPLDTQRLITLVYLQEKNRAEISRVFGVDQNYLRVLIHRAVIRLRTVLQTNAA